MRAFFITAFGLFLVITAHAEETASAASTVAPAVKEIVKVTPTGLEPATVTLRKLDGSVFLVNTTKESLLTFEIDFGEKHPHCASGNLTYDPASGMMRSTKPVGPRDFALACFPDPGSYPVKVFGIGAKPLNGSVIVEKSL